MALRNKAGVAGGPRLRPVGHGGLADDDACGGGAGGQLERGRGQLGQAAVVDGERADCRPPGWWPIAGA